MKKNELKKPEDLKRFKKWENSPSSISYRQPIHRAEKELQQAQSRYSALEQAIKSEYKNADADLDKLEEMESEFENLKSEIKQLMKKRKDLQKQAEQADNDRYKLKQAFINEVAQSGIYEQLIDEYRQSIDRVLELSKIIRAWNHSEIKSDLVSLPPADILYWVNGLQDGRTETMKSRMEEIRSGNYQIRELR